MVELGRKRRRSKGDAKAKLAGVLPARQTGDGSSRVSDEEWERVCQERERE
ncbi:extensin [Iris pallida]|uniref:Extensin n=1 Tax=Iris pallida TaxID=29817 RepID=A0AAX6HH72_IRIPA|nr:extensin [Iris pallida]